MSLWEFNLIIYVLLFNYFFFSGFNNDEVVDFVELTREKAIDVRFIEYMPFTGNKWDLDKFVSYKDMLREITRVHSDFSPLPNGPNDTSKVNSNVIQQFLIQI